MKPMKPRHIQPGASNLPRTGLTQGTQGAALAYDAADRRTALTLPNGIVFSYTYDAASRLIGQTYTGPNGVLRDLAYSYQTREGPRAGRTDARCAGSGRPSPVKGPCKSGKDPRQYPQTAVDREERRWRN